MYLVAYLKVCKRNSKPWNTVTLDLIDNVDDAVFFGGIADTKAEAEIIARDCVNTARGIIIPRVFEYEPPPIGHDLPTALLLAEEWFETKLHEMHEAQANILHDKKLHKESRPPRKKDRPEIDVPEP